MTIKRKLLLTFLLVFTVLGGTEIYLVSQMAAYSSTLDDIKQRSIEKALMAEQLKLDIVQVQQWLTDISATRGAEGFDDGFDIAAEYAADFKKTLNELKSLETADIVEEMDDFSILFDNFYETGQKMAQAYIDGGPEKGNPLMEQFDGYSEEMNEQVNTYLEATITELKQDIDQMHSGMNDDMNNTIIIMILGMVLTGIVSYIIAYGISRNLSRLQKNADFIAKGELTKSIAIESKDEVGKLAYAFEHMRLQLHKLATSIRGHAAEVTDNSYYLENNMKQTGESAEQIAMTIGEVANGVEHQATQSNEILEAMHDTTNQVVEGNQLAENTIKNAAQSTLLASEGKEKMEASIVALNDTAIELETATKNVQALGERSEQIGDIITMIDGIAKQTNLLALNAAIEAARAGESGKGFSIVAEEVRKLSEETNAATNQIRKLIESTQEETTKAIAVLENNMAKFEQQVFIIKSGSETLHHIVAQVQETETNVEQLKEILQRVNENAFQVQHMMEDITSIIEETSAASEEVSASAEEQTVTIQEISATIEKLSKVADELNGQIKLFHV